MKIIKLGGKSLSNGKGINQVLSILEDKIQNKEKCVIVLSARGNATNELELILKKAQQESNYEKEWNSFKEYQKQPAPKIDFNTEFELLENIFEGVKLVEDYSLKTKDLVLAQGELLAAKLVSFLLNNKGITSTFVDARKLFVTDSEFGNAHLLEDISFTKTQNFFKQLPKNTLPVVTGFIASNKKGNTTTLGRNGSNYSASILAQFLQAKEVQNYTHIDGIYTTNPDQVDEAKIIDQLSYQEANELACFGTSILHSKTIIPLIKNNIPLRILNTFNPISQGTLISKETTKKGVKSISVQKGVSVVYIEVKGLLGKTGIDARIFNTLDKGNINIGVISQGSSERGISLIIPAKDISKAITVLKNEFVSEIREKEISTIMAINNISVVTVVGQNLKGFSSSYQSLIKNDINVLLINNTISGNNISLVIEDKNVDKAVNVIHSQIFGIAKKINIAIFGKGLVGSSLINQILKGQEKILRRKETKLNIFAVVGSKKILLDKKGIASNWKQDYENSSIKNTSIREVIDFAEKHHLENLIAIDNTASIDFVDNYILLIENGFDIISSNKIANTISFGFYKKIRNTLKQFNKQYLYETNVGAGLPLIDTIKLLHDSGENISRIRGIFSGSLSYLFNNFSKKNDSFNLILGEAITKGFTEPDPREDLCGNDVARKLLVLARELDLENEFDEIKIENLIPGNLRDSNAEIFLAQLDKLNSPFEAIKSNQKENHVLRYIGDLSGDLQKSKGNLEVKLVSVPITSSLGQVSGSDSIFEIYTESYGENPIVIQGAGAGAEVTARGVFGDLLRIAEKK